MAEDFDGFEPAAFLEPLTLMVSEIWFRQTGVTGEHGRYDGKEMMRGINVGEEKEK